MTLASPLGLGLTALFADATGVPLWFLLAGAITLTCGGLMLLLPSVRTCGRPLIALTRKNVYNGLHLLYHVLIRRFPYDRPGTGGAGLYHAGALLCPLLPFPGGRSLECADGTVFTGCNVENAAYGSSICAERTALVKAVSEGHRDDFTRIAVVGNSTEPCWPCGACRQMLYEFAPGLTVLVAQRDHSFVKLPLSELLTHGFGPKSLG